MADLKIKLKYRDFEVEIEGEEKTVIEQIDRIKQNGLGNLAENVDKAESYLKLAEAKMIPNQIENTESSNFTEDNSDVFPTLKDLVIKNVAGSEPDWVLIYAFYSSEFGSKEFNKADINSFYEKSNRKTPQRIKNLTQNFNSLIKKSLVSSINDELYTITSEGILEAKEIISGKKNIGVTKKVTNNSKSSSPKKLISNKKFNFKIVTNLNLKPADNISLIEFMNQYNFSSFPEKILGVTYYLKEKLKIDKVSSNNIFTGLNEMKERIPPTLKQIIINTKTKGWLEYDNYDNINFTIHGKNFIEHDAQKVKDE